MHEIIISKAHTHEIQEREAERERERERETFHWNETTEPLHLFCLENSMPLHINQILRHEDKGEIF